MNIDCSSCGKRISEEAVACPYCREPQTGLSVTSTARESAEFWTKPKRERTETPVGYISTGVILIVVAVTLGVAVGFDSTAGILLACAFGLVGQIVLLIGVIAKGVQVGNRS